MTAHGRANTSATAVLALVAIVGAVAAMSGVVVLGVANDSLREVSIFLPIGVVYALVGALVTLRTGNVIGWLFTIISVTFPLGIVMEQWVTYAEKTCVGCLPVIPIFFIPSTLVWMAGSMALVFVFLLFPSGRLPEWHGRATARTCAIALSVVWITLVLRPSDPGSGSHNPYGIEGLRIPLLIVFAIALIVTLASAVVAIIGLVKRYRRSTGIERQQMKWLALVGVVVAVLFVVNFPMQFIFGPQSAMANASWTLFFSALMFGIPVAVGFAIMRYRLYDIDRIISRTVSYAVVTAVLGGMFALVVLLPTAIAGVGGTGTPDYVIAAGTLIVAAMFRPVRRRVQGWVDRRFNRSRYDAIRTIDSFSARLREQIDIDALGAELVGVVRETMHPTSASIWMRHRT